MYDIEKILEILEYNEKTALKFHEVETKILSILNFKDFFEILLTDIIERFQVPYVWLTIIEDNDLSILLNSIEESVLLNKHTNFIKKKFFFKNIRRNSEPVLANENLQPFYQFLPEKFKYYVKSIAITPLSLDNEIIGSLNFGDHSKSRFEPDIDSSLLKQLALKVSICLSNVMAHEKLKFLAYHDPLTKLLNRRVMENVLKREFERTKRFNHVLSVIFIDLDNFKIINDEYGHEAGDKVLKFIADKMVELSRENEIIARFAGDEFVIILPETDIKKANQYMERITEFLNSNPLKINRTDIFVSLSYGISSTKDKSLNNHSDLLKEADNLLYAVKKEKKKKP